MKRRTAGAVALAALVAAAGGGTAWWRGRATDDAPVSTPPDLWSQTFQTLDAGPLHMADWRGRPFVLNFWATWCGPCVTEMPLLDRFAKERASSGWRVLALAIDNLEAVRRFVGERSLALPVALAGSDGIDLSRALGNELGALPFSVLFDSAGDPIARQLGAVSLEMLARWVGQTR
jgi:thiol-disulfide isomerase/thioredoxin